MTLPSDDNHSEVSYVARKTEYDGNYYVRKDTVYKLVEQYANGLVTQNIKEFDRETEFASLDDLQDNIREWGISAGIVKDGEPGKLYLKHGHSQVVIRLVSAVSFQYKEQVYEQRESPYESPESVEKTLCEECGVGYPVDMVDDDGVCPSCKRDQTINIPSSDM